MTKGIVEWPAHVINGREEMGAAGDAAISLDPYDGVIRWSVADASRTQIDEAIGAARSAFSAWSAQTIDERAAILEQFTKLVQDNAAELATLIASEAGKPLWESKIEVNSLVTKFAASMEAYRQRNTEFGRDVRGLQSRTRFRPHGVLAVLGPFNFPVSMANGHIMPALLAGNTIVYKPSELTPLAGVAIARLWQKAGLPQGVLNCISGSKNVGSALVGHGEIDGVLFVGSHSAGLSILRALVDKPDKIVALEMGGNSPLIIHDFDADELDQVVGIIIQSAFISSGQRCSAARRLLVSSQVYASVIDRLSAVVRQLTIGHYNQNPEPFYGPMIRRAAAERCVNRYREIFATGGTALVDPQVQGPVGTLITPGIIDVANCTTDRDEEIFGPILKVYRYSDFEQAVELANNTQYGLASGIVCRDRELFDRFLRSARAGIVNWNQQLTGATTFAPFGGIKHSGNFRPAGFLSADYCSYAVASFEVAPSTLVLPTVPGIRF